MAEYDYGTAKNLEIYGSEKPPRYDVTKWAKWKVPSFITLSDSDPFSITKDTYYFADYVEDKSNLHFEMMKNYNHLDYMWSEDSVEDLYVKLIKFLE